MALVNVNVTSLRQGKMPHNVEFNKEMMLDALDAIEERKDQAILLMHNYQHLAETYYNKKVCARPLELNDFVLRKVFENTKEWKAGKLGTNWEGLYKIVEVIKLCLYRLESLYGEPITRSRNAPNLRTYFN